MRHVFVETNWLHDYAAPAHHKVPEAVRLLERAQQGEFIVHIPNVSFAEARQSIWALRSQDTNESTLPVNLRRVTERAGGRGLEASFSVHGA